MHSPNSKIRQDTEVVSTPHVARLARAFEFQLAPCSCTASDGRRLTPLGCHIKHLRPSSSKDIPPLSLKNRKLMDQAGMF